MTLQNSNIKTKIKPCKGVNHAKGYGCGKRALKRTYGLCKTCYSKWLFLPENEEFKNKFFSLNKNRLEKDKKEVAKQKKKEQWKINKNNFYTSSAWKWFSRFVKLYHANIDGTVRCVTSGIIHNLNNLEDRKVLDAGHYLKVYDEGGKTNFSTAFVLKNCYPQNAGHNRNLNGAPELMKEHIIKVHGQEVLEDLIRLSKRPLKLDKWTMDEIAKNWKMKYEKLVEQRGFDPFK